MPDERTFGCPCGGHYWISLNPPTVMHSLPTCSASRDLAPSDFVRSAEQAEGETQLELITRLATEARVASVIEGALRSVGLDPADYAPNPEKGAPYATSRILPPAEGTD